MAIQFVPWEDKETAQQQLQEYVSSHPDAKFYFASNATRPDTSFLKNGEDIVAEIYLKFLEDAISDDDSIGEGVSFRSVLKKTKELNPDFFKKEEEVKEEKPLSTKIDELSKKNKKVTWTIAGAITLLVTFIVGTIIMTRIFGESAPDFTLTTKDYSQILNDADQRIQQIRKTRKKNKDFAAFQAKELNKRLSKLNKGELSKEGQKKLEDLLNKTQKLMNAQP